MSTLHFGSALLSSGWADDVQVTVTEGNITKVTTGVAPDVHKKLKRLAIDIERPVENLLREAIEDLLAKHAH